MERFKEKAIIVLLGSASIYLVHKYLRYRKYLQIDYYLSQLGLKNNSVITEYPCILDDEYLTEEQFEDLKRLMKETKGDSSKEFIKAIDTALRRKRVKENKQSIRDGGTPVVVSGRRPLPYERYLGRSCLKS